MAGLIVGLGRGSFAWRRWHWRFPFGLALAFAGVEMGKHKLHGW